MIKLIVAVSGDWGIGKNGKLLARNKEDMQFFRKTTSGHVVIMGRKTLESFPDANPLPNRDNIVITKDVSYQKEGAYMVHSVKEALQLAETLSGGEKDIFVIGGESIYRQMLEFCKVAYVTKMHKIYEADTYFPNLDERAEWRLVKQSEDKEYKDGLFCFCTFERIE